jgi:outer membrane protein TolC
MLKYIKLFIVLILIFSGLPGSLKAEEVLTWGECIKEAAKNHPDLIAAVEQVKQSEASKKITASTLYPQVDSNLSASTGRNDTGTSNSTSDSYSYGVTGSQLIFDGMQTINNVKSASENIKAAKQNFKFTSATVRYRLRSAFVSLLKTQEMLNITQEIYKIRRENLELVSLRYESGLENKGALLTAEADLADAQYQTSQAKRQVEVAQRNLTKEMGRKQLVPMQVKGDFNVSDAAQVKPDFVSLSATNPSLQQIIARKNAAEFSLKSSYGAFAPTLSGNAGANKSDAHWAPKNDEWAMGLTLSMPIFEGGLRVAQVSGAKALLNQLRENERSTRDGIISTLEQAWATLQDAMENVGVQKENLNATDVRSKIAQEQYSLGFISFDNWTIIEDNLVRAKRSYLDAEAAMLLAEANWIQAKGETLEYE